MERHPIDDLLDDLGPLPDEQPQQQSNGQHHNGHSTLDDWLSRAGVPVRQAESYKGGRRWVLDCCPFDASHKAPDACVYELPSGARAFKCSHASCSSYRWEHFREHYEPGYRNKKPDWDRKSREHHGFDKEPPPPVFEQGTQRTMAERIETYTGLRPAVIEKIVREGEVANFVSESKIGKSWQAYDLAIHKAMGLDWHDRFCMEAGPVLYLDNELHEETTTFRFIEVGKARNLDPKDWAPHITVENFRGRLLDITAMGDYFGQFEPGAFKLAFIDAGYRALERGADENSNGDITHFYNLLDKYAMRLGCAIIVIHHSSKGAQGSKRQTDVGSGAGAQSRAADSHLTLRAHQEEGAFVFEGSLRSWPRLNPFCVRWEFPLWMPDDSLDPTLLKTDRPKRQSGGGHDGSSEPEWTVERFVEVFVKAEPKTRTLILDAADVAGLSERKASSLAKRAVARGLIHEWRIGRETGYATEPPMRETEGETDGETGETVSIPVSQASFFKRDQVVAEIEGDSSATNADIATSCGVTVQYVRRIRKELETARETETGNSAHTP